MSNLKNIFFIFLFFYLNLIYSGVAVKNFVFNKNDKVNICFFETNITIQKLIKEVASNWLKYANINIVFLTQNCLNVNNEQKNNLVRILVNSNYPTESYIGKSINRIKFPNPTFYIGIDPDTTFLNMKNSSIILHEFGHVLGLEHEHYHPSIQNRMNEETIIECTKMKNWDYETCKEQLISIYNPFHLILEPFDKNSIMMYSLKDFNQYFSEYVNNYSLSEKDIEFIKKLYP